MNAQRTTRVVLATLVSSIIWGPSAVLGASWYAGTWDSTRYKHFDRPRTVGIRIELLDAQTQRPIRGAEVSVVGEYVEAVIGPGAENSWPYARPEPRVCDFRLKTHTNRDGVSVFALNWQKPYPWHMGRPEAKHLRSGATVEISHDSKWIRAVDDIEKVQAIEIRHPGYESSRVRFDFSWLLQVGQDPQTECQSPDVMNTFEEAWHRDVERREVVYCLLNMGPGFPEYESTACRRPEFFERLRDERFGRVYTQLPHFSETSNSPQTECGPYFVYALQVGLAPLSPSVSIDVSVHNQRDQSVPDSPARDGARRVPGRARDQEHPSRSHSSSRHGRNRGQSSGENSARSTRRDQSEPAEKPSKPASPPPSAKPTKLGISVCDLDSSTRKSLKLPLGVRGVRMAGANVIIESVNHRSVASSGDFESRTKNLQSGDQIQLGTWVRDSKGQWNRSSRVIRVP